MDFPQQLEPLSDCQFCVYLAMGEGGLERVEVKWQIRKIDLFQDETKTNYKCGKMPNQGKGISREHVYRYRGCF